MICGLGLVVGTRCARGTLAIASCQNHQNEAMLAMVLQESQTISHLILASRALARPIDSSSWVIALAWLPSKTRPWQWSHPQETKHGVAGTPAARLVSLGQAFCVLSGMLVRE